MSGAIQIKNQSGKALGQQLDELASIQRPATLSSNGGRFKKR